MSDATAQHEPVGAYVSLEGAERAVAHLVSCGYDEEAVVIGPRDYEEVEPDGVATFATRWLGGGIAIGAAAMLTVGIARALTWQTVEGVLVPFLLWGAVAGGGAGLIGALIVHRVRAARTFFTAQADLAPTRFEVVAERDPDRARNDLARWWDPAAPSAGWDRTA